MTTKEFDIFYMTLKDRRKCYLNNNYACALIDDDIDNLEWVMNDAAHSTSTKHIRTSISNEVKNLVNTPAELIILRNLDLGESLNYTLSLFVNNSLIGIVAVNFENGGEL